jgi:hypothetical protein
VEIQALQNIFPLCLAKTLASAEFNNIASLRCQRSCYKLDYAQRAQTARGAARNPRAGIKPAGTNGTTGHLPGTEFYFVKHRKDGADFGKMFSA